MEAIDALDLTALTTQLLDLGLQYSLRTLGAMGLLAAVWLLGGWASSALGLALQRARADETVASFLTLAARWSIRGLGLVSCMSVFGVETTSLAALVGGAGVAVGVALKGNLSNLASGLLLLAFRPFQHGDWVVVGSEEGRVGQVGLLHTQLQAFDGARIWIPNSDLLESALTNHDVAPFHRVDVEVGVSYGSDLQHVTEVLTEVAGEAQHPGAEQDPVVSALRFGGSSIDFKVGAWVPTEAYFTTRHDLILAIKRALDRSGIEIPFPQRDLHLRGSVESLQGLAAK